MVLPVLHHIAVALPVAHTLPAGIGANIMGLTIHPQVVEIRHKVMARMKRLLNSSFGLFLLLAHQELDRFGIFNMQHDKSKWCEVYLDDLNYTVGSTEQK